MKRMAASFLTLALVLGGAGRAKADLTLTYSGTVYEPTSNVNGNNGNVADQQVRAAASNPTVGATISGFAASANFSITTSAINFSAGSSLGKPYTANAFIGQSLSGVNGFSGTNDFNNSFLRLSTTTSAVIGQVFTFTTTHDDGINLIVGGQSLVQTGGTGSATYTYTATANGPLLIQLAYGEVEGQPALLTFAVNSPNAVPEPATLTMAGIGLVAFGGYKLRRRVRAGA